MGILRYMPAIERNVAAAQEPGPHVQRVWQHQRLHGLFSSCWPQRCILQVDGQGVCQLALLFA